MRLKYVMSEVMVGLWRNVTMTVAMIITMAVSLTMLGASGLIYTQVKDMKAYYYDKIEVAIFLKPEITDDQRSSLEGALKADPLVREVIYESKDQAFTKFQEMFADVPAVVDAVKPGQLPESFRVGLKNPEQYQQVREAYVGKDGVDQIIDQRNLLEKIFNILGSVQTMALVAASVMAIAALLLVGNTIQVAAYSKRREVAVMKLVGASNWFIQAPFVLEAVVAGLLGAIIGFGALALGKVLLLDGSLQELTDLLTPLSWGKVLIMLPLMALAGTLVSSITAWVTLRFYLRV
ncbi:permease-like cell division protein FtsX [Asanoa sp. WMMD1127]|uniref:permease-like cell division protein FtsX n=1 Tax=Asanoa sp. WMMD1127 TaxID=3016107 RepID=UPI0024174E8A|nr:permease-like cell division protein FtsX [Asanoa sp. WMMD1127]MDG4820884.1 permease-like cell division protein FtsX [Asanoa sp. WMMD1127]